MHVELTVAGRVDQNGRYEENEQQSLRGIVVYHSMAWVDNYPVLSADREAYQEPEQMATQT